jgi:hypothetical protein
MSTLLFDIAAFITANDLRESQFGILALNDKNFVRDLKGEGRSRPRRIWPETEKQVRDFMASYKPDETSAAA